MNHDALWNPELNRPEHNYCFVILNHNGLHCLVYKLLLFSSVNLIYEVAKATSEEVRAKYNNLTQHGIYRDHGGLSCFSPVVNIMRHPLWGRNQVPVLYSPILIRFLKILLIRIYFYMRFLYKILIRMLSGFWNILLWFLYKILIRFL